MDKGSHGGQMKLYVTTTSPYVRKVLVCAHELGVADRIVRIEKPVHVIRRVQEIVDVNPLGQVPTLVTDDGTAVFDSRVICEYLHGLVAGSTLFPSASGLRLQALTEQALADGMLGAALLGRQEISVRPPEKFWDGWANAMMQKILSSVDYFDSLASGFGSRIDIGVIAIGCAVSYLDFRYPELDWRTDRPKLAAWYEGIKQRPSFAATGLRLPTPAA
jgi:glutathione S-transferase